MSAHIPDPSSGQPPSRPIRPRLLDELGSPKTPPCAADDFLPLLDNGQNVLLLGLGPQPEALPRLLGLPAPQNARVRYVEAPEFAAQLGAAWRAGLPDGFEAVDAVDADALFTLARASRVLLYRPGPRLFPGFWGPLLARLRLAFCPSRPTPAPKLLWLPGGDADLLRLELREAFEALGWRVRLLPDGQDSSALLAGGECPALFLSVNFRGLDALGETAHLLAAAGARVAVWCVDNPLHLLSGLRARFWMDLPLFVTDDWFIEPLTRLGAKHARHLPLAARASDVAGPAHTPPTPPADAANAANAAAFTDLADRLVFVGRSAFPEKAGFFAGCTVPAAARTEAARRMEVFGRS